MASMSLRERLWPRLLLSHISLATIPVFILSLLLLTTARQSIEDTVADGNFEVAKRASNEIRLYIEQAQNILRQVADNMDMLDATEIERQKLIENVVVRHELFRELAVLDLDGREQSTTRLAGLLQPHPRADIDLPKDIDVTISQVFIADDGLPMVAITLPIRRFNNVTGYITARVSLKDMWDLVDSVQLGQERSQGFGYAYVVSSTGRLIAHPDRERVYRQDDLSNTTIGKALQKEKSGTLIYTGELGEVVAAFTPIDLLGWKVIIEQPTAEAFARSQEMKWEISILMIVSTFAASLIGILVVKRIVRPIYELVRGTQLFAQGELKRTIDVPGHGEFTMLAEEFNNMAVNLLEKEKQLQRAERLATLSKFASILSHEIRNPLNSMVINLQILKRDMNKPNGDAEKREKYYDRVVSEIWRIDGLVENFLTYSRPPELNRFPHNINDLINEIIDVHQSTAHGQSVTILPVYDEPGLIAPVDTNQMKQVFLNIMINAFDAMEDGGTLTITTRSFAPRRTGDLTQDISTRQRYITVTFQDTGSGIDDGQLERIFEVYFTSKSTGTGLGLPIAQQIVEKHGGKIEVASTPGEGTTFTVCLPALQEEMDEKKRNNKVIPITGSIPNEASI
jgi:two-component system NtrC family sensor kinase